MKFSGDFNLEKSIDLLIANEWYLKLLVIVKMCDSTWSKYNNRSSKTIFFELLSKEAPSYAYPKAAIIWGYESYWNSLICVKLKANEAS